MNQMTLDLGDSRPAPPPRIRKGRPEPTDRDNRGRYREAGRVAADACLAAAERREAFDSAKFKQYLVDYVRDHGDTSGEDLVDAAIAAGLVSAKRLRCVGTPMHDLVLQKKLRIIRSDLPRKRGHGTSGGKLYGLCR